ncbi:MAG TPA: FG-GAP-like repeat-containing protein, partial [Arthrobacter sp.]|nr:FG-GAP-like repeat-containing protein [Arthrobacter sp.]
ESGGTHSGRANNERHWTASTVKPFVAGATGFALGAGLLSATMTGFAAPPPGTEAASNDGKAGRAAVVSGNAGPAVQVAESPGGGTFRGGEGDDVLTGTGGSDSILGAGGNDLITALGGDDVLTGDNGDDAIDAGPGFDIIFGREGNDFTSGGADGDEHILGGGNDLTVTGEGANTVFGGDGDDWIEGGSIGDAIFSDAGSPYGETVNAAGDDVIISNGGQDDVHSGSGDDVILAGDGTQRNDGADGFDWSTHVREAAAADVDLRMVFEEETPLDAEDRYLSVEALSGGAEDDVLRGDDRVPASDAAGAGNVLDDAGIARIAGLADLLPQGTATWGAGNIIVGGDGSDILEGRGGDDIIDGDATLHVRLSVRTNPSDPATETTSAASLDELQEDLLAGTIDPASIVAVLEMRVDRESSEDDTAVFSGAQAEYDVSTGNGVTTVVHARGTGADGTDTLSGIEMLQFSDSILNLDTGESESPDPTEEPTIVPTEEPTDDPIDPTDEPTETTQPTDEPVEPEPTQEPTIVPTDEPTEPAETTPPTEEPSKPAEEPTTVPSDEPTGDPIETTTPTEEPVEPEPTQEPTEPAEETPEEPVPAVGSHDFNGDGNADILSRDNGGTLWLNPGDGQGNLEQPTVAGTGWNNMTAIFSADDFDDDGNTDILARRGDGKLWLYPGDGQGNLQPRVLAGTGWNNMTAIFSAGDFDGDSNTDILARHEDGTLWLYAGNGSDGLKPRVKVGNGWNDMSRIF